MKTKSFVRTSVFATTFAFVAAVALFSSCQKDENTSTPQPPAPPQGMSFTDTVHYADKGATAYNFVYTSTDPYGQPVQLSAAIVLADSVVQNRHSRGFMLYNHISVFRSDECPSRGNLDIEKKMVGSGLITVSADYYGFGATEQFDQTYCFADANAQASIDALLAAKKLLAWHGYTWDDNLFVCGYSQGGQTAMGVVKLVAENYPDLHITCAIAGGGIYDLPATYNYMVTTDSSDQPGTVVQVILAYNHYYNLGIQRSEMFQEPLLSHIDDWILSKQYRRVQVDSLMGVSRLSQFLTPALMDLNSQHSMALLAAFDHSNLCKGWTPRGDENIILLHNTCDNTVPPVNTENLNQFLAQHGIQAELYLENYGSTPESDGHTVGGVWFALLAVKRISEIMNIPQWSIL